MAVIGRLQPYFERIIGGISALEAAVFAAWNHHITERWHGLRTHPGYRQNPPLVLARVALWASHCALRVPAHARFPRWAFRLFLPPSWRGGGSTGPFVFREHYASDLRVVERMLRPGMVVVDAGAGTGIYTFLAARLVGPTGRVLSFEPGERCFRALSRSVMLNGCQQVIVRNDALWDRTTTAPLYRHRDRDNTFSLGNRDDADVRHDLIRTVTLDTALSEAGLTRVDFIKLDVEGAQEPVLRAAAEVLRRDRPTVLLEIDGTACRRMALDPSGAPRFLLDMGYRIFRVAESGELLETTPESGGRKVLAVPAT